MADPRTDERGFTLVEVLVATLLMVVVLMALYALFDMSLRVYGVGNSEVETNEQARIALERMEREIRNVACDPRCIESGSEAEISFHTQAETTAPEILYYVCDGVIYGCGLENEDNLMRMQDGANEALADLGRVDSGDENPDDEAPLKITYRDKNYDPTTYDLAAMVEITLEVEDGGRTQTLNTVAGLRNAP